MLAEAQKLVSGFIYYVRQSDTNAGLRLPEAMPTTRRGTPSQEGVEARSSLAPMKYFGTMWYLFFVQVISMISMC